LRPNLSPKFNQAGAKPAIAFLNGECNLPQDFFRTNPLYAKMVCYAADGGSDIALRFGLIPEVVVGDMDSVSPDTLNRLKASNCSLLKFPVDKDKTDAELLLEIMTEKNLCPIYLFAATGKRLDQTIINVNLLARFPQARIVTADETLFALSSSHHFLNAEGKRVSFISMTPSVEDFCLEGFRYNVDNIRIDSRSSRTLSNQIISADAMVSFRQGTILVVIEN
jgi:thiamine pyrophosphokinase